MNAIEIYTGPDKQIKVEVTFENNTFWLSLNQISELFERDKSVISRHLKNIFKAEELSYSATVAKNATVQIEAGREVIRQIEFYNLDAILSVGYKVNSKRGSQFRQWATQRLTDYLVEGYAVNQMRLEQLQKVVNVIRHSGNNENLQLNEVRGLLNILGNYTQSFVLLNQFDSNNLKTGSLNENITYELKYEETSFVIMELKNKLIDLKEASELFGNPKDESFKGILGNIVQTFDGKYLYPSIEEQAAHLLYFVIKNHPFSDGNKRIGAFLFIWFLDKNKHRFKKSGEVKINDNALVALALLVAQSNPDEKELMIKLIINLIDSQQ
jgi:death-on-curing family protein